MMTAEREEVKPDQTRSILIFDANIEAARAFARLFRARHWKDIDIVSNQWVLVSRLKSGKKYEAIFADLDCTVDDTDVLNALRTLAGNARVIVWTSAENYRIDGLRDVRRSTVITRHPGDSSQLAAVVDEVAACH